eukprot:CAMPEP_0117421828 /NCGR_PEP_ID=MMETSP0758-20121206/2803_1 /TAXON_ID=63605 /ORGANISM="Percolomonas cosmopolitus, Strain AE-1 (ATCC 50343)" /LENGTH=646 /DNA_ID=CAMNT_0005204109 /DNA_START=245 /DNA_END=2185 /DNA_ORIENTATION=-
MDKALIETITGPMENDKFISDAVYEIIYRDKSKYIGQVMAIYSKQEIPNQPCLEEIKRHGFGIMTNQIVQGSNSLRENYFGYWSNDCFDGFGCLFVPGKVQYYGYFKSQYQHGKGVKLYVNDFTRFECSWADGVPYGQGLFISNNIEICGQWDENEIVKGTFSKSSSESNKQPKKLFNLFNMWDHLMPQVTLCQNHKKEMEEFQIFKSKNNETSQRMELYRLIEINPTIQGFCSKLKDYFELKYRSMTNFEHLITHITHDMGQATDHILQYYKILFQQDSLLKGFTLKRYFTELVMRSIGDDILLLIYSRLRLINQEKCVQVDVAMSWLKFCTGEELNFDKRLIPSSKENSTKLEKCELMKEKYEPVINLLKDMKNEISPIKKLKYITKDICILVQKILNNDNKVIDFEFILDVITYSFIHAHYETLHIDYQYILAFYGECLEMQEMQYVINIESAFNYLTSFQHEIRNDKNALYPMFLYKQNIENELKKIYVDSKSVSPPSLNDLVQVLLTISKKTSYPHKGWFLENFQTFFFEHNLNINSILKPIFHEIVVSSEERKVIPEIELEAPTPMTTTKPNFEKTLSTDHFHIIHSDSDDTSDVSDEDEDEGKNGQLFYFIQTKILFPPTFYVTICETIKTFMFKNDIK